MLSPSGFPTDNNPGNSLPVPRPSPAPRNYRPPLLQPPTLPRLDIDGDTGSVYPSISFPRSRALARSLASVAGCD